MPSGTWITAEHECYEPGDCYLNIEVYPLAEDFDNSVGLCGNYNDDATDDLTIKGSTRVDRGDEPIQFATSYT